MPRLPLFSVISYSILTYTDHTPFLWINFPWPSLILPFQSLFLWLLSRWKSSAGEIDPEVEITRKLRNSELYTALWDTNILEPPPPPFVPDAEPEAQSFPLDGEDEQELELGAPLAESSSPTVVAESPDIQYARSPSLLFPNLPEELLLEVAKHVHWSDMNNLLLADPYFRDILNEEYAW